MKVSKCRIWGLILLLLISFLLDIPVFNVVYAANAPIINSNIYVPTDLRMAPASNTDTTVVLIWEKPLFYSNIVRYNIYKPDGSFVGATDKTFYKVLGLNPVTDYNFIVRAQDKSGNESLDSNTVQIKTKKTGKRFNVLDYGVVGDGQTLNTKSIQAAIDAVTPGDTLYFPAGNYLTGGLFLHSNMTVYVDAGARIIPSTHKTDFMPFVMQRHSLEEPESYQSLISAGVMDHNNYGYSVEDIAIIGPGTIGDEDNGLKLREEYNQDIVEVGHSYGGGHLLGFNNAHNVYLDGIRIRNGMMWTIVPVYSNGITAYNLDIDTTQHNGDGFDPNSSENVYILNSTFQTGDDCSAIKSGINQEGRDIGRPSRFIYYRGVTFNGGHGGIVLGSEMSGGVSDVFAEDNYLIPLDVSSGAVSPGFKVKTSTSRGGYIRNIQVRDSLINKIDLNSNYDRLPVPDVYPPDMSNFRFINLKNNDTTGTGIDNIIYLVGAPSTPTSDNALKNVQFINCSFTQAQLSCTENITFNNCNLTKGINSSYSSNILQDGVVVTDKSFPVNEDFKNYKMGDNIGGYWTGSSYQSNLISIVQDGAKEENSLFLNDIGSGYVSVSRTFTPQTNSVVAEVYMKFPTPPNMTNGVPNGTYASQPSGNNRVYQLLSSTGKLVVWLNVESSGALSYVVNGQTATTIIPKISLDTWFSIKTDVDIQNKLVDVYYNGSLVLKGMPFYDVTLPITDINTFKSISPNNNSVAAQVLYDDLTITAPNSQDTGYGINLLTNNYANSITTKGGTLSITASKTKGITPTVAWAVYNSDLTPTDIATIDTNGVLTAKKNGKVVVAASLNDGTAIASFLPITITGQESMIGFLPLKVTTTIGNVPALPTNVSIIQNDGSVIFAPVTWDLVNPSVYQQLGAIAIKGTVTGYSQRATLSIVVVPVSIASYKPVVVKTTAGLVPSMPESVTAIFNNNTTQTLPVVWNPIVPDLYAKTNVDGFTVSGKVQGLDLPILAHVSVLPEKIFKVKQLMLVAADGSGDFKTIQAAIDAVPDLNTNRVVIFVKNGLYYEKVLIPETKPYISLIGESEDGAVLTYNDNPKKTAPDGTSLGLGTYTDYTLMIKGHDFNALNLTVINSSGAGSGQSIAVDVYADKVIFENCKILGFQDTLLTRNLTDNADPNNYANNNTIKTYRSYYKNCFIEGSVDFIFGPGTAVFDHSEIRSRLGGYVTAASTPKGQKFGYVFKDCNLTSEALIYNKNSVSLGRPWRPYAKTVYMNSYMESHISPTGWNNFGNSSNELTAYYGEYNSSGPGANPSTRLSWTHQLTDVDAQSYTLTNIFSKSGLIGGTDDWDPTILTPVASIASIPEIHTLTPVGYAPSLPDVVNAVYSDGTKAQVPVLWDSISPDKYSQNGSFTVLGSVYGTAIKATAVVDVLAGSILTGPDSIDAGQNLSLVYGWSGISEQIYGLDLTFSYNPEQMQFVSADSLIDGISIINNNSISGQVRIVVASSTPGVFLTGNLGRILRLNFMTFTATKASTATVDVSKAVVGDGNGNETNVDTTSYQVLINPSIKTASIADLDIIMHNYGITSAAKEWVDVMRYDINQNNQLDIVDLVGMARKIASN